MRNQTPLAPGEPAFDVTVHIVLNDFGQLGRAYVETDEAEANEATVIENILSGQYSHPTRVVAFNTAEGWRKMSPRTSHGQGVKTAQSGNPRKSFWRGFSAWMHLSPPIEQFAVKVSGCSR
jgi:hypothetical protein